MAFNPQPSSRHRSLAEINITPFVDVMLVLLIIFMVTAPLMRQGIDVNLPSASSQSIKTQPDDVILTISEDGTLSLQQDPKATFKVDSLEQKLTEIYSQKEKKDIFLRADKSVPYGMVIEVMVACKKAGVDRIGAVTEPKNSSSTGEVSP